jgi:hypothetical protein
MASVSHAQDDPEIIHLRKGVRVLLGMALQKALGAASEVNVPEVASELEEACLGAAQMRDRTYRPLYASTYNGLIKAIPEPYGDFLESTLAEHIADGRLAPAEAATAAVYDAHHSIEPRQKIRALFYSILAQDPRFDGERLRDYASRIERGCYNAAIQRCIDSADSYRRQWDSPMFVAVYSGRAGLVSDNTDPSGTVIKNVEGGSWALDRLAEGIWQPESLGGMSASELCPLAGKSERDTVNKRINQKIAEKTSALFACPRCHKRNHTYRQVQIGAGDEPSTFMCTCKECGENYEGYA